MWRPARDDPLSEGIVKLGLRRLAGVALLAIAVGAAGELPGEFRLFGAGWNDSENGRLPLRR